MNNQFKNTLDVLHKITKNAPVKVDENGKRKTFTVTEKQYNWLIGVYHSEDKNFNTGIGVSLDDETGQWSFGGHKSSQFNVPHYIPNREKYGKKYFIKFWLNNTDAE